MVKGIINPFGYEIKHRNKALLVRGIGTQEKSRYNPFSY